MLIWLVSILAVSSPAAVFFQLRVVTVTSNCAVPLLSVTSLQYLVCFHVHMAVHSHSVQHIPATLTGWICTTLTTCPSPPRAAGKEHRPLNTLLGLKHCLHVTDVWSEKIFCIDLSDKWPLSLQTDLVYLHLRPVLLLFHMTLLIKSGGLKIQKKRDIVAVHKARVAQRKEFSRKDGDLI